jgi:preprotein translocase subunit Sss1
MSLVDENISNTKVDTKLLSIQKSVEEGGRTHKRYSHVTSKQIQAIVSFVVVGFVVVGFVGFVVISFVVVGFVGAKSIDD